MLFADRVFLTDDQPRITRAGYLVADVRCARSGIQLYSGAELGKPDLKTAKVFRPAGEVFSRESIATYVGKPLTDDHPPEEVTASNWKKYARGNIGEGALRDGEWLRVPVVMMDGDTIEEWKKGKRELSMGYSCDLTWQSGITDDGQEYDAVMSNIATNHIALVDSARAGSDARIGDENAFEFHPYTKDCPPPNEYFKGHPIMNDQNTIYQKKTKWLTANDFKPINIIKMPESISLVSVKVGDRSVQTTDAGEIIITDLVKARDALINQVAERDKQLATRDARIAELESQILTDTQIDERVANRATLIAAAKIIAKDADFSKLSEIQIRRKALEASKGAAFVADKSDAYIDAAFDIVLDAVRKADPVREALLSPPVKTIATDAGQTAYEKRIAESWKTPKAA